MSNLPSGAENDLNAPYNEKDIHNKCYVSMSFSFYTDVVSKKDLTKEELEEVITKWMEDKFKSSAIQELSIDDFNVIKDNENI